MSGPRNLVSLQSEENPELEGPYVVEKILQKRTINGYVQYYTKWKGWDDITNTWQTADEIRNKALVNEFEKSYNKKLKLVEELKKKRELDPNFCAVAKKRKNGYKEGFDRGFSPERIIGATQAYGESKFLVKWKNIDDADLVPAKEAHSRCPHLVIAFYEKKLTWNDSSNEMIENDAAANDKDKSEDETAGSEEGG